MTIATAIFILSCLLSTGRVIINAPSPALLRSDDIAQRSEQRFAALKPVLPQHGVVGYVGDSTTPADYYLVQYALAPLIVEHSPNHPFVIGNFVLSSPPSVPSANLHLVRDFGNGVLLFANEEPK